MYKSIKTKVNVKNLDAYMYLRDYQLDFLLQLHTAKKT